MHMVFTSVEECKQVLNQININKKLVPPAKWDVVHVWYKEDHPDYIAGGRASIMKPTGGGVPSRWLANLESFNWTEKEEDQSWYVKPYIPPIEEI
jgi:hypothetical protein